METLAWSFYTSSHARSIFGPGLPRTTRGIRIAQVFPGTPAEQGGLRTGDLLFRIDGQIIMANRVEDAEVFEKHDQGI